MVQTKKKLACMQVSNKHSPQDPCGVKSIGSTPKRLTKSATLQRELPWHCSVPQPLQYRSLTGVKIHKQPIAKLMQRTEHLGRHSSARHRGSKLLCSLGQPRRQGRLRDLQLLNLLNLFTAALRRVLDEPLTLSLRVVNCESFARSASKGPNERSDAVEPLAIILELRGERLSNRISLQQRHTSNVHACGCHGGHLPAHIHMSTVVCNLGK